MSSKNLAVRKVTRFGRRLFRNNAGEFSLGGILGTAAAALLALYAAVNQASTVHSAQVTNANLVDQGGAGIAGAGGAQGGKTTVAASPLTAAGSQ